MRSLYLVACVAKKSTSRRPARDLYTSAWFKKARAYVESRDGDWLILSAKHGLVSPDELIEPYEISLNQMVARDRREWSVRVLEQLGRHLDGVSEVILLAGKRYREGLTPALEARELTVRVPMKGMPLGRQLAWLDRDSKQELRLQQLVEFYVTLDELACRSGGAQSLSDGRKGIPKGARGVYFFLDPNESRTDSGSGPRVVRVGTHAISTGASSELWQRLSQHRGTRRTGGGNHRGSVFRLLVGRALIARDDLECETWGSTSQPSRDIRAHELEIEVRVSEYIRGLTYLWIRVEDDPGPTSLRAYIERNSIALLSNWRKPGLDGSSATWLGNWSHRDRIARSGLWNSNHVDEEYEPGFLEALEQQVRRSSFPVASPPHP